MYDHANSIPVNIVRLLIRYLQNKLTPAEVQSLEEWMGESEVNTDLFQDLIADNSDNVFVPEQLLIETEEAIDLWIIAGLVLRRTRKMNDQIEEDRLTDWINACPRNQELYNKMQDAAFTQEMLNWSRGEMRKRGWKN